MDLEAQHSPLLTDLYQLTMAYGYWQLGMHERGAVFHLLFRKNPFQGNYAIACGLADIISYLNNWCFSESDLKYLSTLTTTVGSALFSQDFLDYLSNIKFTGDLDAVAEGTLIFPQTPYLRIKAPLLQCQLLESTLLNTLNFQTLIATKASRICSAAADDPVIEFGMRRAQGPNGALAASRAAFIGGCVGTSNVLAGARYGIPVRGTHGHSWVMSFPSEIESFKAYANALPDNCILLVDTFDTLQGVKHAIEIGHLLKQQGKKLLGIRLDSGDLAKLSIAARKLLDTAGFNDAIIMASNSLDEYMITKLKNAGAAINAWGVGTNLATAYDQPALDGVYKLSALQNREGEWEYKMKLSENPEKNSLPGIPQVQRYFADLALIRDVIYDINLGTPSDQTGEYLDLLEPIFRNGKQVYLPPAIASTRDRTMQILKEFLQRHDASVYPIQIEPRLAAFKLNLMETLKMKKI